MVGNEGMAGMPFILGIGKSGVRAIVQGGGRALRMSAALFHAEFIRNPWLQQALYRYTFALMTRDRVGGPVFLLTHDFLAHMLGLRREGVTPAASALKRRGVIDYRRVQR